MNSSVLLAIFAPAFAHLYGRIRRLEGSPVTLHEGAMFALAGWAFLMVTMYLPPAFQLQDWMISVPITLGIAVGPLALYLLIRSTLHLVRRWEGRA